MSAYKTSIDIEADPEVVFDHFVQPELLVRWMGDYAKLDAKDGGEFAVDINGVIIRGRFVVVDRPRLIEIAWGEAGNELMPPGSTKLVVRFERRGNATHVELEHSGLHAEEAKKHAMGWPYFLGRLAAAGRGGDAGIDRYAPRAVVARFNAAINARDLDALAQLMAADHRFIDSAAHVIEGRSACVQAWRRFFEAFPDYRNAVADMRVEGDVVVARGRSHCSVRVLDGPALWRARVKAGVVLEWRVFKDDADARRALGLESRR